MAQYQHYVQKAYLRRWMGSGYLFLFDKHTRQLVKQTSAERIFGEYDWQSWEMEVAFFTAEQSVGHTDTRGEFKDFNKQKQFTDWLALHLVRNATNRMQIAGGDYHVEVEKISQQLLARHAFWQDFSGDVLITSDNPIVLINTTAGDFFIAPLSPRRCVYVMFDEMLPKEQGTPGFKSTTLNQIMVNTAHRHCVSFDASLHLP
jgi:Protein of unknown function (DUF4238)